jgi:hypothetical protein
VEWTLSVYEVSRTGNAYKIQTGTGRNVVGTFITIYPRSDSEKQKIEALKEGDEITIRGFITGTTFRNIDIEPAILVP